MAFPAPTNDIEPRIGAIDAYLLAQRDGGPALLIHRTRCPNLIRALNGGYRFGKTKAGQRKPTPDKNKWSHVMEAAQYAALVAHGGMASVISARLKRPSHSTQTRMPSGGWT